MKLQDVLFFGVFIWLLLKRNSKWLAIAGLNCFIIAMPLFEGWVFFTAERLTWYGSALIATSLFISLIEHR